MSEDQTPRLGLPLLHIGQAGKEWTHNEALARLDIVVAGMVEDIGVDVPPADPKPGQCWIVGAQPGGEWVGQAGAIAGWTDGGWRFVVPTPGLSLWCAARARRVTFHDAWEDGVVRAARVIVDGVPVIGARQPAISSPAGGATIDAEARDTVAAVLAAMRAHGLIA
ncbi:Protein of unknown function [Sphingomonas palmae]|uniref:DUF2793 domain-containing protein n=1 Tax=Sphingomonas palmae TaxID=1855283 RepID=A0A1H7MQ15_9SPHN|nr:DUF2793 domain-containing protein [Sphingomonas palmae]SEL13211.1 Protein of unknown function [Sphingomonas palmae]